MAAAGPGTGQARQREVERGVRQLLLPEGESALPAGVPDGFGGVHVLLVGGRGRQGDGTGLAEDVGAVDGEEVAQQDRERVAVVDEMVLDVDQPVVVVADPDQVPAQQRGVGGVQRLLGLGGQQSPERGLGVRPGAQVAGAQPRLGPGADPLERQPFGAGDQFEPQAGVVGEHGGEAGPERVGVERPPEIEGGSEVVGATAGLHLLVQPDDLLRGGECEHGQLPGCVGLLIRFDSSGRPLWGLPRAGTRRGWWRARRGGSGLISVSREVGAGSG